MFEGDMHGKHLNDLVSHEPRRLLLQNHGCKAQQQTTQNLPEQYVILN